MLFFDVHLLRKRLTEGLRRQATVAGLVVLLKTLQGRDAPTGGQPFPVRSDEAVDLESR